MGVFAEIKNAKPTEGGRYFDLGNHLVMISRVKKQIGHKGTSFIVEAKVFESSNANAALGCEHAWVQGLGKDGALSRILTFIMKATGCKETEIDEASVELLCSEAQPLTGLLIGVEGYPETTRAGKAITAVKWLPLDADQLARAFAKAKQAGMLSEPNKLQAQQVSKAA